MSRKRPHSEINELESASPTTGAVELPNYYKSRYTNAQRVEVFGNQQAASWIADSAEHTRVFIKAPSHHFPAHLHFSPPRTGV